MKGSGIMQIPEPFWSGIRESEAHV